MRLAPGVALHLRLVLAIAHAAPGLLSSHPQRLRVLALGARWLGSTRVRAGA
jgi:hypothetical protein